MGKVLGLTRILNIIRRSSLLSEMDGNFAGVQRHRIIKAVALFMSIAFIGLQPSILYGRVLSIRTESRVSRCFTGQEVLFPSAVGEGVHIALANAGDTSWPYERVRMSINCDDTTTILHIPNEISCGYTWYEEKWTVKIYTEDDPFDGSVKTYVYDAGTPHERVNHGGTIRSTVESFDVSGGDSLATIVLSGDEVHAYAFKGLTNLNQVAFSSASFATITEGLFDGCVSLAGQIIPVTVTSIGYRAFNRCESLTEVILPEGLQRIGQEAFANCTSLTTIKLPAGIMTYNQFFTGCTNLVAIEVDATNQYFSSFDGALYDAEGKQLIVCPEGKADITVLHTVTNIDVAAFSGCRKLKVIRMPYAIAGTVDASAVIAECAEGCVVTYYGPAGIRGESNPPMDKDDKISITPTSRKFGVNGGGNAIVVSGNGTWSAAVSDPWITLNTTSGNVGYPVAYTVSANTNAEQRTGYVYVSGWVHTITQDGVGGVVPPEGATFEFDGGIGNIQVNAQKGIAWRSYPNVEWLSVETTSGVGDVTVTYHVEPLDEVTTRQGTLTIAGNTFTVFQYGRRMKLEPVAATRNYEAHVIPITVNALDATQWSVTPNNSWISIVDGGNGHGGDLVTIAIAENPSYKARTGTVTIGTETFTVTQQGRPTAELSFAVSPADSTASVNGANGMVSVMATPDLPWTATSGANWITIYTATANGAGNGNVVYSASPNPTLFERTGIVTVTPESESGMLAKTHTVTQPAAQASLSIEGYEFEASGEPCSVEVSCADIVQWSVENTNAWITVNGSISRTGPGTVVLQAAANNTVYPRSGTVAIAGRTFSVSQRARGVEVEYDSMLFGTDGGYESISIHPDGNSDWTAVASDPTWITIFQGDSGTGDGEILYIVAPYVGDGAARTGWIEVGDKKVYISQRAYELSISPNGSIVKGNSGAGEFGVSANIGAVWTAIVTEPWITIISGYDAGTGSGTVRFICADNNTGRPRVGKIIVAGEEYTVTQSARILVQIQATAGRGGSITGAGTYDKGEKVVLTAVPDSGYEFVRWTGPVSSTANPLTMDADDLTGIKAEFEPMPIDFTSVKSSLDGVDLAWNTLAWATTYRLFRGETDDIAAASELATFLNGAVDTYRDETGDRGVTYWYWIMASGDVDDVVSMSATGMRKPIVNSPITYQNLKGATHPNPDTYVEGRSVLFSNPSDVAGYTFAGWTPEQITEEITGAQEVWAAWTAHQYTIVYDANGGSGSMSATSATYDCEATVASNGFTHVGHSFVGWATNATGTVAYAPGQPVTNLTDAADAQLTFYAVWAVNQYAVTFNANGGTGGKTVTQDYGTSLAAPTVTRTGYTFAGWSPAVPATMPAANATYVAQWTKNKYTVTFNANGGDGGWSWLMGYGAAITAPTVTRTGYTFTGWSPVVAATVQVGGAAYTAQWKINQYTVTFNANGGEGGKTVTQNYGTALAAPTVTRVGHTFAGWLPAVPSTMPAGNATYVAQWTKNKYTVTFNANGGTGGWSRSMDYGAAIAAPAVTRTGYTFAGWSPAVAKTVPIGGASYTAQWTINRHKVTLSLNGGEGVGSVTVNYGTKVGDLPVPFREDYEFVGWFTAPTGGRRIADDVIVTGDLTLYAQWHILLPELYEAIEGAAPAAVASEYNGYLVDDDGDMKGTIQVKVGKPNKKSGLATIKATVQLGAKKVTLKAVGKGSVQIAADGPTELELVGGEECVIVLGADGFAGSYGAYAIDGARNFFTSKDKAELAAANAVLGKWLGGISILADIGNFTVTISAKGKAKVTGTLANGKKATGNAVFLIGEEWACVPVVLPKANISFALWLPLDGDEVVVSGFGDDMVAGRGGALKAGAAFRIDEDEFAAVTGIDALPYLPDGVSVEVKGAKWVVAGGAKAGKVMYLRGTLEIDESKLGENPSGLKLTYKKTDGSFKGSFKAYAEVKGKLKATTVSVSGIVLNGVGYGTATVKGKGSVPVTIE